MVGLLDALPKAGAAGLVCVTKWLGVRVQEITKRRRDCRGLGKISAQRSPQNAVISHEELLDQQRA